MKLVVLFHKACLQWQVVTVHAMKL